MKPAGDSDSATEQKMVDEKKEAAATDDSEADDRSGDESSGDEDQRPADDDEDFGADEGEEDEGDDEEDEEDESGPNPDFDRRILCPDGSCIGIIGPDGRCKECGAAMDPDNAPPGDLPDDEDQESPARNDDDEGDDDLGDDDESEGRRAEITGEADDDPLDLSRRVLCSDGVCIGVIGPDGSCKECGKTYDPDAED